MVYLKGSIFFLRHFLDFQQLISNLDHVANWEAIPMRIDAICP